ncbi:MAG: hypothetical protein OEZ58_08355 [Gammaproteobacteria bacterium]|nr:hypothetical protein [Gammaproteobacteria bacterium]MDH5728987.1 hypothetical protein [Gammaproteobacteria bacterium]
MNLLHKAMLFCSLSLLVSACVPTDEVEKQEGIGNIELKIGDREIETYKGQIPDPFMYAAVSSLSDPQGAILPTINIRFTQGLLEIAGEKTYDKDLSIFFTADTVGTYSAIEQVDIFDVEFKFVDQQMNKNYVLSKEPNDLSASNVVLDRFDGTSGRATGSFSLVLCFEQQLDNCTALENRLTLSATFNLRIENGLL